ncbi:MAG: N-acetyltransferase family protein [Chloroflexota bacterium]
MDIHVRPAIETDLPGILDITNEVVANGTASFDLDPRTMDEELEWVKQFTGPYALLVADDGGEVVAWGCLHPYGGKPGYRFTTENSVYIREGHRGQGLGHLVMTALIETAKANGFHAMISRITTDNTASIALHASHGYKQIGLEREVGYKFERWLDVAVMQLLL